MQILLNLSLNSVEVDSTLEGSSTYTEGTLSASTLGGTSPGSTLGGTSGSTSLCSSDKAMLLSGEPVTTGARSQDILFTLNSLGTRLYNLFLKLRSCFIRNLGYSSFYDIPP